MVSLGKLLSWTKLDFSWLLKKNFFIVQIWLTSKKLKFPHDVLVLFDKWDISGLIFEKLLNEFWKKDKLTSSFIWEDCENFDEFHMLDEVILELYNELPISFLACVKWNMLLTPVLERSEFFKTQRFCFDWLRFKYIFKFEREFISVYWFNLLSSLRFKLKDLLYHSVLGLDSIKLR